MAALARIKTIWKDKNIRIKYKIRLIRALVITIFLYDVRCGTHSRTKENNAVAKVEILRKFLRISYKDRITNEYVQKPITKHIVTVRISPGNCKAAETETACDKIGRPNQSETTGNCQGKRKRGRRAYAEKEVD